MATIASTSGLFAGMGAGMNALANLDKCAKGTAKVQEYIDDFDLESYISKPWFSQWQNEQQYQTKDSLNCTSATYIVRNYAEFNGIDNGWTINVSNVGRIASNYSYSAGGMFNGTAQNDTNGFLCAKDVTKNRINVGPCFIPYAAIGAFSTAGNYWVIHYDEAEGEAIIIGGQPDLPQCDGSCRYTMPMQQGMWIFTRKRMPDPSQVSRLKGMMFTQFGLDTSMMLRVPQDNCSDLDEKIGYEGQHQQQQQQQHTVYPEQGRAKLITCAAGSQAAQCRRR